jgi:hypothetical protein
LRELEKQSIEVQEALVKHIVRYKEDQEEKKAQGQPGKRAAKINAPSLGVTSLRKALKDVPEPRGEGLAKYFRNAAVESSDTT